MVIKMRHVCTQNLTRKKSVLFTDIGDCVIDMAPGEPGHLYVVVCSEQMEKVRFSGSKTRLQFSAVNEYKIFLGYVMRRSIRSFNIPSGQLPGHLNF